MNAELITYDLLLWWSGQMAGPWYVSLLAVASAVGGVVGFFIGALNLTTGGGSD